MKEKTTVEELSYIIGGLEGVLAERNMIDTYVGLLDEKEYENGYNDANKEENEPNMFDYFKEKTREEVLEELNKVTYPFQKTLNNEMEIKNGEFIEK